MSIIPLEQHKNIVKHEHYSLGNELLQRLFEFFWFFKKRANARSARNPRLCSLEGAHTAHLQQAYRCMASRLRRR